MSTHNIGFYEEISKIIFELSSNTHLISSAGSMWVLLRTLVSSVTILSIPYVNCPEIYEIDWHMLLWRLFFPLPLLQVGQVIRYWERVGTKYW